MITNDEVDAILPQHGFIKEYVDFQATINEVPKAFSLGSALACLVAVSDHDLSFPFAGRSTGSNLWILLVGPSRIGKKSTAIDNATGLLNSVPFPIARIKSEPKSPEGLVDDLKEVPNKLILYPEFGNFLKPAKIRGSREAVLKSHFTDLWDRRELTHSYSRGKNGKQEVTVDGIRLSMLAGVSNGFLNSSSESEDWDAGFFGRFMFLHSQRVRSASGMRAVSTLSAEQEAKRKRLIGLLTSYMHSVQKITSAGAQAKDAKTLLALNKRCKGFSEEAREQFDAFSEELDAMVEGGRLDTVEAIIAGASDLALKIAMLATFDCGPYRSGGDWGLGPQAMRFGIDVARLHMKSVLEVTSDLATSPSEQARFKVLRALSFKEWTSFRDLLRRTKMSIKTQNDWLQALVRAGTVRQRLEGYLRVDPNNPDAEPEATPDQPMAEVVDLESQRRRRQLEDPR